MGFHDHIDKVVHGLLHLHRTYVAELCDSVPMQIGNITCDNAKNNSTMMLEFAMHLEAVTRGLRVDV